MAAFDIKIHFFPKPTDLHGVRKLYDELRVKKRFDSVTPEEQDWLDWAERYLDEQGQ